MKVVCSTPDFHRGRGVTMSCVSHGSLVLGYIEEHQEPRGGRSFKWTPLRPMQRRDTHISGVLDARGPVRMHQAQRAVRDAFRELPDG